MLVYDGDCGFCTSSARWIARRLPATVPVVPWQSLGDLSARGLTVDDVTSAAWWLDDGEAPLGGHLAIGGALRAARPPWSLLGRLLLAPPLRWLAGPVYRWVARHRYRMPGASDACRIEPPR
ncbi:thiol-disulfide oxidoreductase DCC family protein [Actinomarinicola tropica]|uniref:DUF393 domain-containing protein n=1 Tax=Actinomarinicola tropica TaxID=2789776 RepID=A0A5Q2RNN4_9ACTN|nr:DUF393 domain-containing protein [Actinomarinicola tropica]QGG96036.1 DUF393 domain-containing protein [Actinomarinicola tropica]